MNERLMLPYIYIHRHWFATSDIFKSAKCIVHFAQSEEKFLITANDADKREELFKHL